MGKAATVDAVLSKALRVLGHAEFFKPVRYLPALQRVPLRICGVLGQRYPNEWL